MKMSSQTLSGLVLTVIAFVFGPLAVDHATAGEPGFYFDTSLGVATVDRMAINDDAGFPNNEYHAEFEPGPSLSLGGGYRICDWFSAGADVGFIWNRLSVAGGDFHLFRRGTYYCAQVPTLANFEFRLPNKSRIIPFVGGGPGFVYRLVHFPVYNDDPSTEGNWVFAWQVYGGVRYQLSEKCSLGAVFKFLDAASTEERTYRPAKFGETQTKSLAVSFKVDF